MARKFLSSVSFVLSLGAVDIVKNAYTQLNSLNVSNHLAIFMSISVFLTRMVFSYSSLHNIFDRGILSLMFEEGDSEEKEVAQLEKLQRTILNADPSFFKQVPKNQYASVEDKPRKSPCMGCHIL